MSVLAALLAQLSGGGKDLPDQSGRFEVSPTAFVIVFGAGFVIAMIGHLYRSRTMVGVGIAMIFLSTVLVPIYLQVIH
jgi:Flp pilus assembly protein TadB